jgi:hypothetical protein
VPANEALFCSKEMELSCCNTRLRAVYVGSMFHRWWRPELLPCS